MKTFYQFQEDIAQRRIAAQQQTADRMASAKQVAQSYHAQKAEKANRERLKSELKAELQTEQTPTMEPNIYNQQVARQQATWKGRQIRQSHGEMQSKAQAELAAKKARLKAIMSR
jgi:hypothetical protein